MIFKVARDTIAFTILSEDKVLQHIEKVIVQCARSLQATILRECLMRSQLLDTSSRCNVSRPIASETVEAI
jgi:hypothetical protein